MRLNLLVPPVLGALLAACGSTTAKVSNPPPPAAPVRTATAVSQTIPVELTTIGNVEAYSTIVVKAQIGGTLQQVFFKEGDTVRKDDPLFEIDPRPYQEMVKQWEANRARDQALLQQAEANLSRAEAQEAHYGKQAERYERLAQEGVVSREQADQAVVEARARRTAVRAEVAAIGSAKAAIHADEAALSNARLNLSYCTIRSPIDGRTGNLLVKQGNLVKATDVELVTIHQIQPIYVTFSVPEVHLPSIRQRVGKLTVRATTPGNSQPAAVGAVTFIDNAVDRSTGSIRLKGTFTNQPSLLWPGQFVDVKLRLEERPNAVVVPAAALQTGQNGNYVYVVKPDQSVELRQVKPGPRLETGVSVDEGLAAGEVVVTEGHLRLAPGMKVRVLS